MPMYTYRREDGTTFEIRQKFSDDPLEIDPETGQKVHRVIHPSGIIFKGSGFYVTDNSNKSRKSAAIPAENGSNGAKDSSNGSSESAASSTESKSSTESASSTSGAGKSKGTDAAD